MTPNELLLWLSARKQGSWSQFRGAVKQLDLMESEEALQDTTLPLHQRVRLNLERLGHAEFDTAGCEDGWRVVPPALGVIQEKARWTGVYCGARTPALLKTLEQLSGIQVEQTAHTDCPDIIRLHAQSEEDLGVFATAHGFAIQTDCPASLLSCLPRIDSPASWHPEAMPASGKDWDVKHFVIKGRSMRWHEASVLEANAPGAQGLFCFTRYQMPQYFLRRDEQTVRLPGAIGKYIIAAERRRRVLRYDRQTHALTVPAIFRPPLLTERGLLLCSGFPPTVSAAHQRRTLLTYRDVPEEIAGMVAETLRQDFL